MRNIELLSLRSVGRLCLTMQLVHGGSQQHDILLPCALAQAKGSCLGDDYGQAGSKGICQQSAKHPGQHASGNARALHAYHVVTCPRACLCKRPVLMHACQYASWLVRRLIYAASIQAARPYCLACHVFRKKRATPWRFSGLSVQDAPVHPCLNLKRHNDPLVSHGWLLLMHLSVED